MTLHSWPWTGCHDASARAALRGTYIPTKNVGTYAPPADVTFGSYIGVPGCIIWAVLKVISVLSTARGAQPASVLKEYPPQQVTTRSVLGLAPPVALPRQITTAGVLGLTTPDVIPQAKRVESPGSSSPPEPELYTYSAPGIPMCPRCNERPTIFYCSTHQAATCLQCVAKHDEPERCVYVPAFRKPKSGK
jgi:hypothetical protein